MFCYNTVPCKNQRPNPRPDLKRGREEGAAARRAQVLGPATRNLTLGTRDRSRCSTRGTQGDWSCVRPKGPRLQPCACRLKPPRGTRTSSHTSPLRGRVGMAAVRSPYVGPDQSVGPGGLATPGSGGCLRALPRQSDALLAFRADGAVVWSTDGAPTPCVVFLIGFASLINSLTWQAKTSLKIEDERALSVESAE